MVELKIKILSKLRVGYMEKFTFLSRDVARHGLGGLKPPKHKYSPPPNEMKLNSPFGLGLMFFAKFFSTKLIGYRTLQFFNE